MAKSEQAKLETESIIRWSEAEQVTLWTSSPAIRKEWESYGFVMRPNYNGTAWRGEIPLDRLSYKVLPKSVKK